MAKNKKKALAVFAAMAVLIFSLAGTNSAVSAAQETSFSLPGLSGGDYEKLLENPDRGFRYEFNAFAGTGTAANNYEDMLAVWGYPTYPEATSTERYAMNIMDDEVAHYAQDKPKLAQVYVYLTRYTNVDTLPQEAFDSLDAYFEKLKSYGIKAVLRFAYAHGDGGNGTGAGDPEWDYRNTEPNPVRAIKHVQQLSAWMEKWKDQIHVVQAGMIGAWGEWAGGAASAFNSNSPQTIYPLDKDGTQLTGLSGGNRGQKALLTTLLECIPEGKYLQVRYAYNKYDNFTAAETEYYNRIGFHDDSVRGSALYSNNTGGTSPGSAQYQNVRKESAFIPVDGELYWATSNWGGNHDGANNGLASNDPMRLDDGLFLFGTLKERHFTSLSIVHNYKERGKAMTNTSSMLAWQNEYVNRAVLEANDLNYNPDWLKDEYGNPKARSLFEYLRDHLGYQLKAESGGVIVNGTQVDVNLSVTNYGMAAPLAMDVINLVILDQEGTKVAEKKAFNLADLQPMADIAADAGFTVSEAGTYRVALEIRSSTGEGARLANDLQFTNGYNILGSFTVEGE